MNCTALYVTGNLTISGGANEMTFGPTYVGGNFTFSGSHAFNIPLLVCNGSATLSGSQQFGSTTNPCMLVMTGANQPLNFSGASYFYGVIAAVGSGDTVTLSGSSPVDGAVFAAGTVNISGSGGVTYDSGIINNFSTVQTTAATLIQNTWEEISPS